MGAFTEWFEGRGAEDNEAPRLTVIPWVVWAVVIVSAIVLALRVGDVHAQPTEDIALIVIVITPDGQKFLPEVHTYPDAAKCHAERMKKLKEWTAHYGKEFLVFSTCTKLRTLGAVEI